MDFSSFRCALVLPGLALVFLRVGFAFAAPPHDDDGHHGGHGPVYQRHSGDGGHRDDKHDGRDFRRDSRWMSPPVSAGLFQRPYPYHLDYYRMRYGGSYAPYFGNLYGPSVPAYYGPYYGGYGPEYSNGQYPVSLNMMAPGAAVEQPSSGEKAAEKADGKSNSEGLPAPKP